MKDLDTKIGIGIFIAMVLATMMLNAQNVLASRCFVSNWDWTGTWDIYTIDITSGAITRLTTDRAIDNHPDISPDGTKIVWSSTRGTGNDFDIYIGDVSDAEGTAKRLTFDSYAHGDQIHYPDRHPQWSPDGSIVVFTSGNRAVKEPAGVIDVCSVPRPVWDWIFFEGLNIIKIDSDGDVVAYVELDIRDAWDKTSYPDIWVDPEPTLILKLIACCTKEGKYIFEFVPGPLNEFTSTYVGHPSFSPDGSKILFTASIDGEGTEWEVYTVGFDSDKLSLVPDSLRRITKGALYPENPNPIKMTGGAHFTSDGTKIIYSSTRTTRGNSQLFWADTSDIDIPVQTSRRLTWHLANDYVPEPQPDGRILLTSDMGILTICDVPTGVEGSSMDLDIFIMNADGSGRANLTDDDTSNQMFILADEVSWFCGLSPNLTSCTYMPRIMNKESLWLMRYASQMIPTDLLERFNIPDAQVLYNTYWQNLTQWVANGGWRIPDPSLLTEWQHISRVTENLMNTFPGFGDPILLTQWLAQTGRDRDEIFVFPSIMGNDGIGDRSILDSDRIDVLIDIKPGREPNSINISSKGVTPVAILTTETFSAERVDSSTVVLARARTLRANLEDVDGDGDLDMLLHFQTQDLEMSLGDNEATLTGNTLNGAPIHGSDSVRILVSQRGKGKGNK